MFTSVDRDFLSVLAQLLHSSTLQLPPAAAHGARDDEISLEIMEMDTESCKVRDNWNSK